MYAESKKQQEQNGNVISSVNQEKQFLSQEKPVLNSSIEPDCATSLSRLSLKDEFDGIPVSREWLMKTLSSKLSGDNGPKLKSIKCERVDKGQGYMSCIGKVTMEWARNDHHLPKSVVVKVPTMTKVDDEIEKFNKSDDVTEEQKQKWAADAAQLDFNAFLTLLHNNECFIYQFFADQAESVPVPIPRFYGSEELNPAAQKTGYILIEDLTETTRTPDAMKGLSEIQCREVVRCIAALQAYGIVNHSWNDGTLKEIELEKFIYTQVEVAATTIRKHLPDVFTVTDEKLNTVLEAAKSSAIFNASKQIADGTLYPVLTHGDLWINNMLFRVDKSGAVTDTLAALIDWQIAHPGPCTEDLVRVLILTLEPDVRKRVEKDLLLFYFHTLKQHLVPSGTTMPFSLEEVVESYRSNFSSGALVALSFTLMFLQKLNEREKQDAETEDLKRTVVRRSVVALEQAYEYAVAVSAS